MWNSIGIPSVPGLPSNIGNAAIKMGGGLLINAIFGNYWGIFDQNGIPLLLADNVKSVKYKNTSKVSTAPLEMGSFTNYNKVIEPYSVDVIMTKGSGGVVERSAFLGLLDTFANSTDLFMVITPEAIYPNCNITGYDYSREHNDGARLLKVNIHLQEIREVKAEYTETKADTSSAIQKQGKVSPTEIPNNGANKSALKQMSEGLKSGIDSIKNIFKGQ